MADQSEEASDQTSARGNQAGSDRSEDSEEEISPLESVFRGTMNESNFRQSLTEEAEMKLAEHSILIRCEQKVDREDKEDLAEFKSTEAFLKVVSAISGLWSSLTPSPEERAWLVFKTIEDVYQSKGAETWIKESHEVTRYSRIERCVQDSEATLRTLRN